MIIYHATKTRLEFEEIKKTLVLKPGKNVKTDKPLVHISVKPFLPGNFALDVIGRDTNHAWVLKLEVDDFVPLDNDPSGESDIYGGGWRVSEQPIKILRILSIDFISNVLDWEENSSQ